MACACFIVSGKVREAARQKGELRAEGWLHLASRRDRHFRQPLLGQVAAAGLLILGNVAGDIGQLECQTKVAGPVQRGFILRADAHEHSHHATHRASDMIAVAQHVGFGDGPPILRIQGKAFEQVMGVARRNGAFAHDEAKAIEGRVSGSFAA